MDENWVLRTHWSKDKPREDLLNREWLVTNGLGGYASGTLAGVGTRRYHGLLIAALASPLGRQMMLNHLTEMVRPRDGKTFLFGGQETVGGKVEMHGAEYLTEFRLETGLPVWHYEVDDIAFEKRVFLPYRQNTAYVSYRLVKGSGPVRLKLRLAVHFRSHDEVVSPKDIGPYQLVVNNNRYEIQGPQPLPPLRLQMHGQNGAFTLESAEIKNILYRVEENRGYDSEGTLWCPGYFRVDLADGHDATLVASTESWEVVHALQPEEAWNAEQERRQRLIESAHPALQDGKARELILAADQFLIKPTGRIEDAARARAAGDEIRSVIAGYHWFTDWGRDTMISLDGLTLATGRRLEAGYILRTFAHYIRDGLIPNMFPEGQKQGLYHTADATLWYFHALHCYLEVSHDRITLRLLLPKLLDIFEHHMKGTNFGIGVDRGDGLLKQGAEGFQLTWMDAKCGDWVVTPRRGKAVEINALWYNALAVLERWLREENQQADADRVGAAARRARDSFNRRFFNEKTGCLFDVVDCLPIGNENRAGDDPSIRPNQVFAISLPNPVLEQRFWKPVMEVVEKKLLTPFGLRTLSEDNPEYKKNYHGDLKTRDAAYHQGTVWPWLIGPFVDAWLKLYPDNPAAARQFLEPLVHRHLTDDCIGQISEVCDAEPPFKPRGCIAQAWSVAEVLRSWIKTGSNKE